MSSSDLRDRMDGLEWETPAGKMDAVYPGSSASVPFPTRCTGVQASGICMSISNFLRISCYHTMQYNRFNSSHITLVHISQFKQSFQS